jgi:hypothetical protein
VTMFAFASRSAARITISISIAPFMLSAGLGPSASSVTPVALWVEYEGRLWNDRGFDV